MPGCRCEGVAKVEHVAEGANKGTMMAERTERNLEENMDDEDVLVAKNTLHPEYLEIFRI